MNILEIKALSLSFGDAPLVSDLHLSVQSGEWVAILGRSGCGKSTLLKAIAQLGHGAIQTTGNIQLDANISYMAQQDSLLPWLSVRDNVQLTQYLHGEKNAQTRERALELLSKVGLSEHAKKMPYELSGGQRQRVALARTLMHIYSPFFTAQTEKAPDADSTVSDGLILMDEPFSAVDAITRLELQCLSTDLLGDKAVILITHDPLEAIRLADTIYVMHDGGLSEPFIPEGARPRFDTNQAQPELQQKLLDILL